MTTVSQPALSETPRRAPESPRRGSARVREDRRTGYALIAPTAVIVLVMVVLPIIWTVSLAFQHVRLINLRQTGFFGRYTVDNFVAVLTSPTPAGATISSNRVHISRAPHPFPAIADLYRTQVPGYMDGMTDEEKERELVYEVRLRSARLETWLRHDEVTFDEPVAHDP